MPDDDADAECDSFLGSKKMSPPHSTRAGHQKASTSGKSSVWHIKDTNEEHSSDQENGYVAMKRPPQRRVDPITECRDMSGSVWLYFPHVELLFLLFAFKGVVAAQVVAVRNAQHSPLRIVATLVLVSFISLEAFRYTRICLASWNQIMAK